MCDNGVLTIFLGQSLSIAIAVINFNNVCAFVLILCYVRLTRVAVRATMGLVVLILCTCISLLLYVHVCILLFSLFDLSFVAFPSVFDTAGWVF